MIGRSSELPASRCFYGKWDQYIPLYAAHGTPVENGKITEGLWKWRNPAYLVRDSIEEGWKVHRYYDTTRYREEFLTNIKRFGINPKVILTHPSLDTSYIHRVRKADSIEVLEGIGHWGWQSKPGSTDRLFFHKFFHSTYGRDKVDVHFSMMIDVRYIKVYRLSMFAGELPDARWFKLLVDKEYYRTAGRSKVGKWLKSKVAGYAEKGLTIEYHDNISDMLFCKIQPPVVKSIREHKEWLSSVHSQFISEL